MSQPTSPPAATGRVPHHLGRRPLPWDRRIRTPGPEPGAPCHRRCLHLDHNRRHRMPSAPKPNWPPGSRSGFPSTGSDLTWPGPAAPAVAAIAVMRGGGEHAEEKESPPPSPAPARAPAGAAIAATALPAELHAAHARGGAVGLLPHAPPRERRKAPPPPSLPAGRPCQRPAPAAARRGRGGEGLLGFGGRSRPSRSRGSDAGEVGSYCPNQLKALTCLQWPIG